MNTRTWKRRVRRHIETGKPTEREWDEILDRLLDASEGIPGMPLLDRAVGVDEGGEA